MYVNPWIVHGTKHTLALRNIVRGTAALAACATGSSDADLLAFQEDQP